MTNSELQIRQLGAAELKSIQSMWLELYDHQRSHGLLADVTKDGFDRWVQSLSPMLGRFGCLFIAVHGGETVGFLAGRIKSPTPPFGPSAIGFISEVFVGASHRGNGIAKMLMRHAQDWFARQGIVRLELQVLTRNSQARAAYRQLGWEEELVQMVYVRNKDERSARN